MRQSFVIIFLAVLAGTSSVGEAQRIVSASGVATEILFALGLGDRVVAVDTSSVYPSEAERLPKVGYARALSTEGILSMEPGVVILGAEAGPPEVLEALRSAGVRLITLEEGHSVEVAMERIRQLGEYFGRPGKAAALCIQLRKDLATISNPLPVRPRVLFIYARGGGVMNVSGQGTAASAMIELAGGANAIDGFSGFKALTPEAAIHARPDVLLLTTRGLASVGGKRVLLDHPGLKLTPAGRSGRVVAIDDLKLLGFGPRMGEAAGWLNSELRGVELARE